MIAIIDIGNSRIKIKIGAYLHSFRCVAGYKTKFAEILKINKIQKIFYSSVNKKVLFEITKIIGTFNQEHSTNIELIEASTLLETKSQLNFNNISGMGHDRKFGLVAAAYLAKPPIITVDCGTAITVNVIDENYVVLGGMIMSGVYTQAKALKKFTSNLPHIHFKLNNSVIGNNTQDAINSGINVAAIGGIKYAIEQIKVKNFHNHTVNIFFTGGYGQDIMNFLNIENSKFIEELIILGIEKTVTN